MGDIRDVDGQRPAGRSGRDGDGVVKIPGACRVNGDDGAVRPVLPAAQFRGRRVFPERFHLLKHGGGEFHGQVILSDDGFHVHVGIVRVAEHLHDFPARGLLFFPAGHGFHGNQLAGKHLHGGFFHQFNVFRRAYAVPEHAAQLVLSGAENAQPAGARAFRHFLHAGFHAGIRRRKAVPADVSPALGRLAFHAHGHAVPVQGGSQVVGLELQLRNGLQIPPQVRRGGIPLFGEKKNLAGAQDADHAVHQVPAFPFQGVSPLLQPHEPAFLLQLVHNGAEVLLLPGIHVQGAGQF